MAEYPPESVQLFDEPALIVEIAWTDNYAEPFPDWTDITDYVQAFDTKLGRSTEIGAIESGIVNITLDNSTGAFTPGNVNSPFYPNVKPRRQVRVRVDDGGDGVDRPTLVNLVLNPDMKGDNFRCGYTSIPDVVTEFGGLTYGAAAEYGFYGGNYSGGNISITAWSDLLGTVPFACSPGQYISTRCGFFSETAQTVRIVLHFFDGTGTEITSRTHSEDVPASDLASQYFAPVNSPNTLVPAGAVGFSVEFKTVGTAVDELTFFKQPAVYVTDAAEPWPGGVVPYFSGSSAASPDSFYVWSGERNRSVSWQFDLAATESGLGRGYVERWPVSYSGVAGEVTVPVVDWLSSFGSRDLVRPLEHEYMSRNPADLFKFNDESESGKWASTVNPFTFATPHLQFRPSSSVYTFGDGLPVPHIDGGQDPINAKGLEGESSVRTMEQDVLLTGGKTYPTTVSLDIPIPVINGATDSFSFAFLWEIFGTVVSGSDPAAITLYDSRKGMFHGPGISFVREPDGNIYLGFWDNTGTGVAAPAVGLETANKVPIFGGFSWDHEAQVFRTICNSFAWPINDQFPGVAAFMASVKFDACQVLGYNAPTTYWGVGDQAMQYLARFDRALGLDEFRAMQSAADGLEGQTASQRMTYILDMIQYPVSLRRIADSPSLMQRAGWQNGTAALEWLNSTTDSVLGSFYVDPSGFARFVDRRARAGAPIAHTFDHDAGTGVETGLTFELAEDDIINVATIENAYGVSTSIRNEASILEYGAKEESYSLHLLDDNEAVQLGYHIVNRNGEPSIRLRSVSFNPSASAYGVLWEHAKGIRIGQRIHIAGLPDDAPATEMDFFVESVSHNVVRDGDRLKWLVTLELSPGDLAQGWILGDATYGILGETTTLLY